MKKDRVDGIITEYLPKIYGFSIKKSFSYNEAEEICSDIISELYPSLIKSEEIFNLEGYVFRISEHVYSKYVSAKKRAEGFSIDGMDIPFFDDYDIDDFEEEKLRLRREIAFLSKTRRNIIFSYYYENKTVSEIAKKLNMPVGTVKWHLNKAKNKIKEGFNMERKIGKLGLNPIKAEIFGHNGHPGNNGDTSYYLGDKLNLNIVYSVYHSPKTKEEIAEELGVTPVFIEDKIEMLENNGFLVREAGDKFTTYVQFHPETFSLEQEENIYRKKLEVAEKLAQNYVPKVRAAVSGFADVYIPGGNRELFEAFAVFFAVSWKCNLPIKKDISKYYIKTLDGGEYIANVVLPCTQRDKDYKPAFPDKPSYWACGSMTRDSRKYKIYSWAVDTRYCTRKGGWVNNRAEDYEYLYEFMTGMLSENNMADKEKIDRLREREFISDGKANIMVMKGCFNDFSKSIPELDDDFKREIVDYALESAELEARDYPPQMQDLIIYDNVKHFIGNDVAIMVKDILYKNGTFKSLTENEKVTTDLVMFSDKLPNE